MDEKLKNALDNLSPASLSYQEWINVGMAIKAEGGDCEDWDAWSRNDTRYHAGDCEFHWRSFDGDGIKGGTVIHLAQTKGTLEKRGEWSNDGCISWEDEIYFDGAMPPKEWNPVEDLKKYISTLFQPDEFVSFCTKSLQDEDGKWKPMTRGVQKKASQIISELDRYGDIPSVVGSWEPDGGAWIRFNPMDGVGARNENVVDYRYALVESDSLELSDQEQMMRGLQLPIAAMVNSGGKSIHAIVRIGAKDFDEYKRRVSFLYEYLSKSGMEVDTQNKNPSRLSRMPGVTRGDKKQYLIDTNIGKKTWQEWIDFVEGEEDDLPPIESLADYADNAPELPPELISGILRQGHKMLISGSSKAGKSFLLMELCVALAEGKKWLSFQCKKSKVLYVNLEIDQPSCIRRFRDIYDALGYDKASMANIQMWNLRGKASPLSELVPKLVRRVKDMGLSAVIIDPIYKVIMGDENNASEMGKFCNEFDKICSQTGCSAIYCHHHSKGAQGGKRAMDRASGSGVFARDPDAQLDIIQLEQSEHFSNMVSDHPDATAWRIESSLREFANIKPVNFWFTHPIHRLDESGQLEQLHPEGSMEGNLSKNWKASNDEERRSMIEEAVFALSIDDYPTVKEVAKYIDATERTVRNWIDKIGGYDIKNGVIMPKRQEGNTGENPFSS